MPTSPRELDDTARPRVLAAIDAPRFASHAGDDRVIFFCVEGAPRAACRTTAGADGTLTFSTRLAGRVLGTERDALLVEHDERVVTVRHHLPPGLDLEPLAGRVVEIELAQIYRGRGRATIDAEIRDEDGRVVLWAHDGRYPDDRDARGLSLRAALDGGGARLAIRGDEGITSVACPGLASVVVRRREWTLALVRLAADDVGFVLLRR